MSAHDAGPAAIVVGLDCITGLQTARILRNRGVRVIGIAGDPTHFSCRTRACERVVVADVTGDGLVTELERLGPGFDEKPVLFPCTDQSVMVISRHREQLEPFFHVLLPNHEQVELLMDKVKFTRYAHERGLAVPPTRFVSSAQEAQQAAEELRFPVVLKPALKTADWKHHNLAKVYRVGAPEELLHRFRELARWTDEFIVQEWIEGRDADLYSCNCYFDRDGRPQVTFVARKLRQWPVEAGTSSLGEECRNDEVLDETLRLFEDVGYRGLGYVEVKRDGRSGRHYIIEPNVGRPTGRSAIAEAGGVELLYTMYCDAIGRALPAARQQRYRGVKWIYFRHDLQSAIVYVLRGELDLLAWWRSWRGRKVDAVWSGDDPVPFLLDWAQTVARVPRRLRAKRLEPHATPHSTGERAITTA